MIDDIFQRRHPRKIRDLNIVPILDMLTTVIFFLLLSVSFVEVVKLNVPPAATVTVLKQEDTPPPVAAKLILAPADGGLKVWMSWAGKTPGLRSVAISGASPGERRAKVIEAVSKMSEELSSRYPDEKSIQLGLSRGISYQDLISAMDGVREKQPDVILISYSEAEARASALGASP